MELEDDYSYSESRSEGEQRGRSEGTDGVWGENTAWGQRVIGKGVSEPVKISE